MEPQHSAAIVPIPVSPRWRIADLLWLTALTACLMGWARFFRYFSPRLTAAVSTQTLAAEAVFVLAFGLATFIGYRTLFFKRVGRRLSELPPLTRNLGLLVIAGVGLGLIRYLSSYPYRMGFHEPVLMGIGAICIGLKFGRLSHTTSGFATSEPLQPATTVDVVDSNAPRV